MKYLFSLLVFAVATALSSYGQNGAGAITGRVTDAQSHAPLEFATVRILQGQTYKAGTITDVDGRFEVKQLTPGKYRVEVSTVGYTTIAINDVFVKAGGSADLSADQLAMEVTPTALIGIDVVAERKYEKPLFEKRGGSDDGLTDEELIRMADRDMTGKIRTMGGVTGNDDGSNQISIRGARPEGTYTLVDGVKFPGMALLPQGGVGSMTVYTGGIPSEFGDVTGGVISITTKGVSDSLMGSVELISSGVGSGGTYVGLDPYGYNLAEFSLSGPLLRLSTQDSTGMTLHRNVMGFFIAGNFTDQLDPRPSAIGNWVISPEALQDIKDNPLRAGFTPNSVIANTDYLRLSDFDYVRVRPNARQQDASMTAKIDVLTTQNTNFSVGASGNVQRGARYTFAHSLMDFENYPMETTVDWRVYGRFTQRFPNGESADGLKNVGYTIQADYSQNFFQREREDLGDDFFQYGYIGKFQTFQTRDFAIGQDSVSGLFGQIQRTYRDTLITFTPGTANPELARFTQRYYELNGWEGFDAEGNAIFDPARVEAFANYNNIQSGGGLVNGDNLDGRSRNVYGMWVYNGDLTNTRNGMTDDYTRFVRDQYRITGQGLADWGNHNFKIGFEYEQRIERSYSLDPVSLWTIARLRANSHIQQIDLSDPSISYPGPYVTYDRLNAAPGPYSGSDEQSFIDYNLRKALGLDPDGTDYVDVNAIDPSLMQLNYFSADELYNSGNALVNYYGYTPYGQRARSNASFDDFFTAQDNLGNYTRPIGAFQPVYVAGYVEDSYEFRDINLRVGLRVDRYDANQMVLKDPYVLFPTVKAGEDEARALLAEGISDHPSNIGDDYVVYVDNVQNPTAILGYRDGSTWYNSEGAELSDASALRVANGLPAPLLVNKERTNSVDITSESFRDYDPKLNVMPRITFNFPISDFAKFYAHYDVLTKRPSNVNRLNPADYYYLESRASQATLNNPDLQPERTIDYEVGFEQKITYNSALRVSAYYRESRNMVQAMRVFDAYPMEYTTYGNIDFSTVKGMIVNYDYRTKGNMTIRAYYTLQFAEGTGSNNTSQLQLARSGQPNLRAPIRLAYDQRHQITMNIDYRYGTGEAYNGPLVKEHQVLAGMGANLQLRCGSGMPYNPQTNATSSALFTEAPAPLQRGDINSASLPWKFRFDLSVDRDVDLKATRMGRIASGSMNVYVQVLNLLNARTLAGVYRATGNPDDDGYLNSAAGKNFAQSQNSPQAFTEYYTMKLQDPANWELPRRIRFGMRYTF